MCIRDSPHGAKDKLPRSGRACVNALVEAFGANEDLLREAILKGLSAKPPSSFPYLRMVVEHNVGAPEQPLSLTTKVVHEYHEAPPQR